ncbi:MAG TPA: iron-siderophore ABC transporter substrate-binding protein [Acidimicrobiales bacterium]|nr:iron-siderophore ABC transporter substrate-binding protein [Acidimicrobiales bacterium]
MRTLRPLRLLALALAATMAVAACSGSSDDDTAAGAGTSTATSSDAFPVTIEHAFGETEITEEPQRVVTWGWGSADAAIALGVVPVAIPFDDYAGDDGGVLPWIREAVEAEGAELPEILPNAEEPPFEAIAAQQPDVIIAAYSGITEDDYELLSDIAPTVAYPGEAWATPWRDLIEIVGTSLGRTEQADDVLAGIDTAVAEQAEAHPELAGKSVAMVWDTPDSFYVYKAADPRVEFTLDLGMVSAESVDTLSNGEETFYYSLSYEQLEGLESDILVSFADTQEQSDSFLASARAQLLPQVADGTVAEVIGTDFIASVSPPTALSLTWGLDEYVTILSAAAQAVDPPA